MQARLPVHRPGALAGTALAATLALALAACGSGTGGISQGGDVGQGAALFKQKCGGCHTLAAAGTRGAVGPNLDDAFASDRKQGFSQSTMQQVVAGQIRTPLRGRTVNGQQVSPTGGPVMPADIVTGDDVDSVAAYVASVAGTGAKGPAGAGGAASGKEIFQQECGGCHTLADAGTTGAVGPNLDQAKPSKALAVTRVSKGKGQMPPFAGRLSAKEIDAVTDYVSTAAGK